MPRKLCAATLQCTFGQLANPVLPHSQLGSKVFVYSCGSYFLVVGSVGCSVGLRYTLACFVRMHVGGVLIHIPLVCVATRLINTIQWSYTKQYRVCFG